MNNITYIYVRRLVERKEEEKRKKNATMTDSFCVLFCVGDEKCHEISSNAFF